MKLAHTMIRVKNIQESVDFYTDFLGLRETRRSEIPNDCTLVFLTDESGQYHIEMTYNHDDREYQLGDQFGHLAFVTQDLDSIIEKVEEKGWWYRQSRPEMKSRYIFVKDPNGYDIEILQAR